MIHKISASALVCALFAISMTAYAQGRPAGAGNQGGGGRPAMSQQQDRSASMRQKAEARRQKAEEKRLAAESMHTAGPPAATPPIDTPPDHALANRAMGKAHNKSAMMRDMHPPAATLPEEAGLKSGNDRNAIDRGLHRNTQGVTQRDAGTRVQGDDDEPDDD